MNVAVCGIQLVDERGNVSRTSARFPTFSRFFSSAVGLNKLPGLLGSGVHMSDWRHDDTKKVDHVIGAFYLVRRGIYKLAGGFDERYFVCFEDVDLSKAIHDFGYTSCYLTNAKAFHAGGGTSRQVKAHRLFYSLRSRLLYGFKYFSLWQAWLLVVVTNLFEPCTRLVWCVILAGFQRVKHIWAAYRMLWLNIGHTLRGQGTYNP